LFSELSTATSATAQEERKKMAKLSGATDFEKLKELCGKTHKEQVILFVETFYWLWVVVDVENNSSIVENESNVNYKRGKKKVIYDKA